MALSPDLSPASQGLFQTEIQSEIPSSGVVFDQSLINLESLSREDRTRMYYAQQLAIENFEVLTPRYRTPEDGSDQESWRDILVADPLNDPRVSELATMLIASGFKHEPDPGKEF